MYCFDAVRFRSFGKCIVLDARPVMEANAPPYKVCMFEGLRLAINLWEMYFY